MRGPHCLLLVASLIVLSAAASSWAVYPDGYDPRYVAAVNDSAQPLTFPKVDDHLTTITGSGPALMTCFTDWSGYSRAYDGTTQSRPKLWVTAAPELWQFYQDNNVAPQDMSLRTKQLLGLPANNKGYFVMEFYVQPSSLFRPAMNPDITNPTTSLTFQGQMADPNSDMRKWFDGNFSTYNPPNPVPWTRAGYTYDWASDTAAHIGLTEFIADDQTATKSNPISVRSVISLISYKYYVRNLDAFDVTDSCDTIWLGSKFLPVTAGGNWVDIHPGVQVSGGEGITVTDLPDPTQVSNWTITNAGTIQGPGVNHDGTPRDSSVWFTNTGGTLNNSGTITGDKSGVLGSDTCTQPIVVNNTGTIRGSQFAIRTGGGDDTITTSGLIDGNINTGPGNDTINICGGTVTGSIDGGTGTNRLNFNLPGDETFTLDHDILEMAEVNVRSGIVSLHGQVSGAVTVYPVAMLGGNCTLLGSLNNGGFITPGDGIGTMAVRGNYTQSAGGCYIVEVAKPSSTTLTSDHLNVDGTATLAAGSYFEVRAGGGSGSAFQSGDSFHVLNAASGLSDGGARVTSDSAFLGVSGAAVGKDYVVTLHRTATFASAAAPGNRAALAAALDADTATAAGPYAGLIDQLMFSDAAGFNAALPQLSPAAYLTVEATTDRTTQYMAEALADYLHNRRAGQINPAFAQTSSYEGAEAFARAVGSPSEMAGMVHYCANERNTIDELQLGRSHPLGVGQSVRPVLRPADGRRPPGLPIEHGRRATGSRQPIQRELDLRHRRRLRPESRRHARSPLGGRDRDVPRWSLRLVVQRPTVSRSVVDRRLPRQ